MSSPEVEPDGECVGLDGGKGGSISRVNLTGRTGADGDDMGERSISRVKWIRPGPESNAGGRSISRVNLTTTAGEGEGDGADGEGDGADGESDGAEDEGDGGQNFARSEESYCIPLW